MNIAKFMSLIFVSHPFVHSKLKYNSYYIINFNFPYSPQVLQICHPCNPFRKKIENHKIGRKPHIILSNESYSSKIFWYRLLLIIFYIAYMNFGKDKKDKVIEYDQITKGEYELHVLNFVNLGPHRVHFGSFFRKRQQRGCKNSYYCFR